MLYVELERLTDKSTLLELARHLWKRHEKLPNLSCFTAYYDSFKMTQRFLIEIWGRILNDLHLDDKYWNIQAEVHYFESKEEDELSEEETKILEEYSKHEFRLNLDVEDWFLHAHILMEKYVKLFKSVMILTSNSAESAKSAEELPNRSFNRHVKSILKLDNQGLADRKYLEIINGCKIWYYPDLKDVRDDLIEHEQIGRFWGRATSPNQFNIGRFRQTDKMEDKLCELRDKYEKRYAVLKEPMTVLGIMHFFEANITKLEEADAQNVRKIRKDYGKDFPDIPALYTKMNSFFSSVNDYLLSCEK